MERAHRSRPGSCSSLEIRPLVCLARVLVQGKFVVSVHYLFGSRMAAHPWCGDASGGSERPPLTAHCSPLTLWGLILMLCVQ